jgi:hypothetical protein
MAADSHGWLLDGMEWADVLRGFRGGGPVAVDKDGPGAYHGPDARHRGAEMPRKSRKETDTAALSVRPPRSVAPDLGDVKSVELALAVRCWAKVLRVAGRDVASLFSAAEWDLIARALRGRGVEPEVSAPAALLADYVSDAQPDAGGAAHEGPPHRKGVPPLAERLAGLSYPQAWAVVVAVRFRWAHAAELAPGEEWWQRSCRVRHLLPDEQEEE